MTYEKQIEATCANAEKTIKSAVKDCLGSLNVNDVQITIFELGEDKFEGISARVEIDLMKDDEPLTFDVDVPVRKNGMLHAADIRRKIAAALKKLAA